MTYDRVIIGAGIYGLYAAQFCAKLGHTVLVLEYEDAPFTRASSVNQARLHMGYHYPRSYTTAITTAKYFDRFVDDYKESIKSDFEQVYATSAKFSLTNKEQFIEFCKNAGIRCENIDPDKYFLPDACDGAYLTKEYAFDAEIIKTKMLNELKTYSNVQIRYGIKIESITRQGDEYVIGTHTNEIQSAQTTNPGTIAHIPHTPNPQKPEQIKTKFVITTTYAAVNQLQTLAGFNTFQIKYELCELALCKVSDNLKNIGLTVMDGPFFSLMPFGKTEYYTLSSVTFTPNMTCYSNLPTFECQENSNGYCSPEQLGNCNTCPVTPESAWPHMIALVKKYMKPEYKIEYVKSLFSIKPILKSSEIDDSRPTLIRKFSENPTFVSVLSGKINTIYDMDEILREQITRSCGTTLFTKEGRVGYDAHCPL